MSNGSKKLLAAALKMPRKSRAELAEKLLESLDEPVLDEAIEEAERRWQAFKEGKIKAIPIEEVFPKLAAKNKTREKP
jgi:putative addiction module component (TIGR02574 family)